MRPDSAAARGLIADTIPFSSVDGPGNRFVVFFQGCNFDCVACHNPQTIPGHAPFADHHPRRLTVEDLLCEIRPAAPFIRGITASGGEATQQGPFLAELFAAVGGDAVTSELTRFVDTNGACDLGVWEDLAPVMDGAMVDLKSLDPAIHERMTGQPNEQVLASIERLHALGRLYEVRLLLVAGLNDDPELLRRTAAWLAAIDERMRLVVIGFRTHGSRPQEPALVEPTPDRLAHAAGLLQDVAPFEVAVV